jgi:hypothetical protein
MLNRIFLSLKPEQNENKTKKSKTKTPAQTQMREKTNVLVDLSECPQPFHGT